MCRPGRHPDSGAPNVTGLDIVLGAGMKALSNYTNHIADT
jgi:hypothetical protein